MGELELRAVAIAVATWAPVWAGHSVLVSTDNESTRLAITNRRSPTSNMRALLRFIGLLCHTHQIRISAQYINTKDNKRADLLSRDKVQEFLNTTPSAPSTPTTPLPVPLPK